MKQIFNQGNLPSHVAVFARALEGRLSSQKQTEFWEAANIAEFEKKAVDIGYEIIPTLDASTSRGYLVGFDVEDSIIVGPRDTYSQLKMYFVEVTAEEFKAWVKKINQHRKMQQEDYFKRKEENTRKKKKLLTKTTKEDK